MICSRIWCGTKEAWYGKSRMRFRAPARIAWRPYISVLRDAVLDGTSCGSGWPSRTSGRRPKSWRGGRATRVSAELLASRHISCSIRQSPLGVFLKVHTVARGVEGRQSCGGCGAASGTKIYGLCDVHQRLHQAKTLLVSWCMQCAVLFYCRVCGLGICSFELAVV